MAAEQQREAICMHADHNPIARRTVQRCTQWPGLMNAQNSARAERSQISGVILGRMIGTREWTGTAEVSVWRLEGHPAPGYQMEDRSVKILVGHKTINGWNPMPAAWLALQSSQNTREKIGCRLC